MTSPVSSTVGAAAHEPPAHRHEGLALIVIAAAQLMVVLDATIVNIALPSIERDFHIGASSLAWIVDAYALTFGGLLLLGGRSGDLYGRRRMFRVGLTVFVVASLLGGLAPDEHWLIAARVVQGIGAAVIAPTALSLIATTFAEGNERSKAMGVYAAMAGVGSTIGLLLGGVLTDYLNWRWVLFVNVPIGAAVLLGSRVLAEGGAHEGHLDIPGAVTGTGGLVALVYGIIHAGEAGWGNTGTLVSFAVAVVLLAVFLVLQAKTTHPMLPLRLLRDRNRAGAYTTMLLVGSAMFATFYFLTLYMQQVLGYSPVKTGLAYLPFSFGMMISAGAVVPRLTARVAPRVLIVTGTVVGAAGMYWFHRLTPASSYWTHLMPAMAVTALGLGAAFLPLTLGAVAGTTRHDAGIASALLNAGQQVGGALGLAVLSTIAATASNDQLPQAVRTFYRGLVTHDLALVRRAAAAMSHGDTTAFGVASLLLLAGAAVAFLAVNARPTAPGEVEPYVDDAVLSDTTNAPSATHEEPGRPTPVAEPDAG